MNILYEVIMKLLFSEADRNKVLSVLRNPHGFSEEDVRRARVDGAELIERYWSAYKNMKEYAESNGLDTVCRYP